VFESDDGIKLQTFSYDDVIGRTIICADGVARKVEQLSPSYRYPTRVLVNEINEDETPGGAWVHMLSLACQMYGDPLPTPEQIQHFNKWANAIDWQPESQRDGKTKLQGGVVRLPSGLLVNKADLN
jgi:hypothetical protein